jgi:hypothetical protein
MQKNLCQHCQLLQHPCTGRNGGIHWRVSYSTITARSVANCGLNSVASVVIVLAQNLVSNIVHVGSYVDCGHYRVPLPSYDPISTYVTLIGYKGSPHALLSWKIGMSQDIASLDF